MKPTKLFFLIFIFFALVKVSLLSEYDALLMGIENYKANKTDITFGLLYMNLKNITMEKNLSFVTNTTYLKNSSNPNSSVLDHHNATCLSQNTKLNDDYIYYSCVIPIVNISNISKISIWEPPNKVGGEVRSCHYIPKDPMFNIVEFTKELYVFNLTEEIEEKNDQIILKGKMHKNFSDNEEFKIENEGINGTLNCQKANESLYECKLSPTSPIVNQTISERDADSSKSKIVIFADYLKNFYINYSKNATIDPNEKNATIISIGNFNHKNKKEDAKGKIYLRCGNNASKLLKNFIKFYVNINYNPTSNLRMLQNKEQIEVIGTKNLSEISKDIVSYDLIYKNTTNKTISEISSPCNISFSDNETFIGANNDMNIEFEEDEKYDFLEEIEKKYELMNFNKNSEGNYDAEVKSSYFSFGFDTQDDIINIDKNADVEVSYKPVNESRFFDKCIIENNGSQSYNIKCSPKRNVFALMNTIRIDITNLLKKRRLNSVRVRILQNSDNTTLIPDENSQGVIDYRYGKINKFTTKKKSRGLSGGAITAIILSIIVAILATLFLFYFFNRSSVPLAKNSSEINIPNSSTNINS